MPSRRPAHHNRRRKGRSSEPASGRAAPGEVRRLKVDQPEELLALMPYLLGFRPSESLVMMVIADRVVKVTVRVDLVDDVTGVAQKFGAIAVTNRASGVVLIAYSADPGRADAMLLPVMDKLASLRVIEAIYTNGRRWWSRSCGPDCCPAEGIPYDPGSSRLAAEAVFHGMTTYADRTEIERLTAGPAAADLPALQQQADRLAGRIRSRNIRLRKTQIRELVADYVERRASGDNVVMSDRELITLALLAMDATVRDQAWSMIERENAWIHVELWQRVVSRAVPALATPAVCLLGAAAWIQGQGALQVCCIERARQLKPEYSMIGTLADINDRAVPPAVWDRMKVSLREAVDAAYS